MTQELTQKITKLKKTLIDSGTDRDINSADLKLVRDLVRDTEIDVASLQKIDEEIYGNLITRLIHHGTEGNRNEYSATIFEDIADLHFLLAENLTQGFPADSLSRPKEDLLHKKLKYYTDSATFLNYVLLKNEDQQDRQDEVLHKLYNIYEKMLSLTDNNTNDSKISPVQIKSDILKYQNSLKSLRTTVTKKLEAAEASDSNETIQSVFEYTAKEMKGFLATIYQDTMAEISRKPPCKFAIMGLGSMALKQITPWSDLEFAIILDKYTPESVEYFRNLSHLVNFKCINLGETIIPYDKYNIDTGDFGKVGVNFDLGGKTPLGRIGKNNVADKEYSLIGTEEWLMNYVRNKDNGASQRDKNLPYILENVCYVYGNEELVTNYQKSVHSFLVEPYEGNDSSDNKDKSENIKDKNAPDNSDDASDNIEDKENQIEKIQDTDKYQGQNLKNHQVRALKLLEEGAVEIEYSNIRPMKTKIFKGDLEKMTLQFDSDDEGSLLDVKQEIYRLPDLLIHNMAKYFGVHYGSAWERIERLTELGHISKEGAANLIKATDFATILRLKSYAQSDSQSAAISTYIPILEHLPEIEKQRIIKSTFHVQDKQQIYDFYHTMLGFTDAIKSLLPKESRPQAEELFSQNKLSNIDNHTKGRIYAKFLQYDKALEFLGEAYAAKPTDATILKTLYRLHNKTGNVEQGVRIAAILIDNTPII